MTSNTRRGRAGGADNSSRVVVMVGEGGGGQAPRAKK